MIKNTSPTNPDFVYYQKGDSPTLLIHTGTHGDEYETIDLVKKALEKYEDRLPDFLFVPKVSPSAVSAKTRFTKNGSDLNRIFYSDSDNLEVIENIKLMKMYKFELMVSFHEDPESGEYYIYDSGYKVHETHKVKEHNKFLKESGIKLLNGFDDIDDPSLGYEFTEGYRKFIDEKDLKSNGMTTVWAMSEGLTKEALTPEIPGKLSLRKKDFIVDSFFQIVLFK